MWLNNKVAIITGAANGIGLAAALRFAEEGAKVKLADYDEKAGRDQENALKEQGYTVKFIQVDVANRESVETLVQQTVDHFGQIHILVNNARITRDAMLTKMTADDFSRVLDVNLTGVFNCTQAVVPHLIDQGYGKIINTSSVSGVYVRYLSSPTFPFTELIKSLYASTNFLILSIT